MSEGRRTYRFEVGRLSGLTRGASPEEAVARALRYARLASLNAPVDVEAAGEGLYLATPRRGRNRGRALAVRLEVRA
jgi:hypothetical protein